jgi:hypothetical protein
MGQVRGVARLTRHLMTRIYFDRIDSVKLILAKIDFKLKWFMFGYIHVKVS